MKVRELVEFLQEQDQDLDVAYRCFSEACILDEDGIEVVTEVAPRSDGWIHTYDRRDKPKDHPYLMFPGN